MSEIQSMNHDGLHRSLADKILVLGGKPGKDSGAPVLRHILQDGVLAVAAESGLSTEIVSEQKPVVVVYVGIGAKGHLRKHLRRDFPCQSQGWPEPRNRYSGSSITSQQSQPFLRIRSRVAVESA